MRPRRVGVPASIVLAASIAFAAGAQPCEPHWNASYDAIDIDGAVRAIVVGGGGELFIGGAFGSVGGQPSARLARFDGASWAPLGAGVNDQVAALAFRDGDLYAAGLFTTAGAVTASHIARWDGQAWSDLAGGLDGDALTLAVFEHGETESLIVGGEFSAAGGVGAQGVASWTDGQWSALDTGLQGGDRAAAAMTVHDDGDGPALYVGGSFLGAGGQASPNIVRWDGQSWSAVGEGLSGGPVRALASHEGELIAGGSFTQSGEEAVHRLARWDGQSWSEFGGADGAVHALDVVDAGGAPALVVGGEFLHIDGEPAQRIAMRQDGQWSALADGMESTVRATSRFEEDESDGPLLVVGAGASTPFGQPAQALRAWTLCEAAVAGDLNGDGVVDGADLAILLSQWGEGSGAADLDGNGVVDGADLAILLSNWG